MSGSKLQAAVKWVEASGKARWVREMYSQTVRAAEAHLLRATCERSHYRTIVKNSKDAIHTLFTTDDIFTPPLPASVVPRGKGPLNIHYPLTTPNRSTILLTPSSQALYILRHPGSVVFLGCAVGDYLERWTTSLMRTSTMARVPTQLSACLIISLNTTRLERKKLSCMLIIVFDKTRTTQSYRYE